MILRKLKFLGLVLLLCSCNTIKGKEESVFIYDPIKNKQFINLLIEKKVEYRIQDDGLIFYPAAQNETVKEVFEKIMGKKIPALQSPK